MQALAIVVADSLIDRVDPRHILAGVGVGLSDSAPDSIKRAMPHSHDLARLP